MKVSDDAALFTVPVEQAHGSETFEELVKNLAEAIARRDFETARAVDEQLQLAVNRITAEHVANRFKRKQT